MKVDANIGNRAGTAAAFTRPAIQTQLFQAKMLKKLLWWFSISNRDSSSSDIPNLEKSQLTGYRLPISASGTVDCEISPISSSLQFSPTLIHFP